MKNTLRAKPLYTGGLLLAIVIAFGGDSVAQPSGTWTLLTGALGTARFDHRATALPNGQVLVVGGQVPYGIAWDVETYDPNDGIWRVTGSLRRARYLGYTATLLNDGRVLVTGGSGVAQSSTAELYDPETGTSNDTSSMTTGRRYHTATLLNDGRVLVTGGVTAGEIPTPSAALFDPETGSWSDTGALTTGRSQHTATLLNDGRVLVAGGWNASAELYDPATGAWTDTGSMTSARVGHTATLLRDGRVLIVSGPRAEVYNPETESWSDAGPLTTRGREHTATLLNDGRVLVTGGGPIISCEEFGTYPADSSSEVYDPGTGSWSETGRLNVGRGHHTATLLNDGTVLAAGGVWYWVCEETGSNYVWTATAELYVVKGKSSFEGGYAAQHRSARSGRAHSAGYFAIEARVGAGSERASTQVHAVFDLAAPTSGPFPSDWFTVGDPSHNTGLRIDLAKPDCLERPSGCEDIDVLNTLDGFNLQPRLSIPFDGPIDVETATSATVFLLRLGDTLHRADLGGQIVGINQIVWDPATNKLHVESDELLDQHTRYALIVTRGVRDVSGAPVEATETFRRFRHTVRGDYKHALLEAVHAARRVGVREDDIAVASVFTTQSVTAVLEKIRDQIKAATPEPADFRLWREGAQTVFARSDVAGITFNQQTQDSPALTPTPVPLERVDFVPGAVGVLAFGKFTSPDYETDGQFIPQVGTRTGTPAIQRTVDVYFNLFIPSGPKPAGGWPIALHGHGFGGNKQAMGTLSAVAMLASQGIAVLAINVAGHGFGHLGTLHVNLADGRRITLPAGGRGIDQNGDAQIGPAEGLFAAPPHTIIWDRDGQRQTVIDLIQCVRVIQAGMDVDDDGVSDIDPSRIYYYGVSLGGMYGAMLLATEPDIRAGALVVPGGSRVVWSRLGTGTHRNALGTALLRRVPSLINVGGIVFNEDMPLRNQPALITTVEGALVIQEALENQEWVSLSGDALGYMVHLRRSPLDQPGERSVIVQFAKGDTTVPNPAATALIRAGDLADRTTYYRNDLAFDENPAVPRNPHNYVNQITVPALLEIARGAQEQIAVFFASDGTKIIHPQPARFFEVPIVLPLPEALNFLP